MRMSKHKTKLAREAGESPHLEVWKRHLLDLFDILNSLFRTK